MNVYGHERRRAARSRKYKVVKRLSPNRVAEDTAATPVVDWRTLEEGMRVQVREYNRATERGWFDDVTADGMVLWIVRDQGAGRILVERTSQTTVHLLEDRPAALRQETSTTL
jgi:hypothetical protein